MLMLLVATLWVVGCGGSHAPPSLSSRPQRQASLDPPASLSELVAAANSIRATAVRVEGELRVELASQRRSWSYDLDLIAARSGALRLRARSGRGGFEIASDGSVVSARTGGGEVSEQVPAKRFLDLATNLPQRRLPLYSLVDALLPRIVPEPPLAAEDLLVSERHPGETRLVWVRRTRSGWRTRRRIAFDSDGRIRWFETFDDRGLRVSRVSYGGWGTTQPPFPTRFELVHASGVVLQVVVRQVELDPRLQAGVFDLTATTGDG